MEDGPTRRSPSTINSQPSTPKWLIMLPGPPPTSWRSQVAQPNSGPTSRWTAATQAVGSQINPELINVEPILVSVSPKVNMAGKAVAKPWQLTKPPKFGPKPKEDKLTLAPYPKPHTLG